MVSHGAVPCEEGRASRSYPTAPTRASRSAIPAVRFRLPRFLTADDRWVMLGGGRTNRVPLTDGADMPDPLYKRMTAFLLNVGINDQPHTGKTYIGHLLALHRILEEQGCNLDTCRAGLF